MSTIRTNPEQVTVSDPTVARQFARAVAQEQATGSTSPVVVTNSDTLFNQATAAAANAAPGETSTLTVTSSPANDAGDVVTVYRTTGGIAVTAVNETVNQYTYTAVGAGVTQIIAGNNVTITSSNGDGSGDVTINATIANLGNISTTNFDGNYSNVLRGNGVWGPDANSSYGNSNVASYLPTYTGNISGDYLVLTHDVNANVVQANYLYGNGSNITNLPVGNIANINLDGNASNVLRGDGTFGPDANSSYGDSNVTSLLGAFGSNNISTTGNISVGDLNVTGNVTSDLLPNANITYNLGSNTQRWNDIWLANSTIYLGDATLSANGNSIVVDSITVTNGNVGTVGNIASLNLDGSNSNVLYGNGIFAAPVGVTLPIANGSSNINIATANGNVTITSNGTSTWTFGDDGNLVLPNGNSVIYSIANSSLDPTLPNVSTMTLTPDANYNSQVLVLDPTAPGHIHLRAHAFSNIDDPAANIFLGGEQTAFEITQGANNEARIHSNNYTWTYGNDGNLTLPGNTFAVNYANGTQVSLNGLPAGSNNQIQFNSNGAFGASANYTFTDTVGGGTVSVGNELNLLGNGTIGTSNNNLNIQPAGNLVVTASAYNWTFDIAGNLTLPGNTFAVNYANGSQASAPLVDITDTNGLTTVYYPTFVENRTTGQIVRADVDLSYRTDTNTLTVGNIVANNLGNISSINIDGNVSNVLTGNGTFVTLPVINANTVVWSTAPVANTSNGTAGQAAYDSGGNLYVCVATDTWAKFTGATSW